uniref:Sulfatase N-terminal domain-containing protein n=1 Tax=Strigamia maritima TaxID=126957 RepID=T1J5L8_STRMM
MNFTLLTTLVLAALAAADDTIQPRHKRISPPNIIYILGDDIGYNDVGWNNPNINTPHMDKLAKEGVILDNFYSMPLCTPSRAALLSGLYAQQLGLQRGVIKPQEPYGIPLKYKLLPERLKLRGYRTHAIGKWHLGFCDWRYTPTYRGFDTFLGFYQAAEENYQHCLSSDFNYFKNGCNQFDFRHNEKPAPQYTGQYSSYVYGDRAVEIIRRHSTLPGVPLFMYVAVASSHFPVQGDKFTAKCKKVILSRREFCGAMMGIDEVVYKIIQALKRYKLYDNTILVFTSDNGGSTQFGGSNFPLRGEKGTLYEGGNRVPAFIHSPLLKKTGYKHNGLFHIVDWYTTFLHVAGIRSRLNGVNQWDAISSGMPSPRREFPYFMDKVNGTIIGAVRVGNYKLINGPGGQSNEWYLEEATKDMSYNNSFIFQYASEGKTPYNIDDRSPKLFNLAVDPYEKNNLAQKEPNKLEELRRRFNYYFRIAKPAVEIPNDPTGDPNNFGGIFSPGWCVAKFDVPLI